MLLNSILITINIFDHEEDNKKLMDYYFKIVYKYIDYDLLVYELEYLYNSKNILWYT